jgi:hypothetical protein
MDFFFIKNNMTVVPHPPYSPPFPRLNINLKGSHFDTIEVIEAETGSAEHPHRTRLPRYI